MKIVFSSQHQSLFLLVSLLMWPLSSLAISEVEFNQLINNTDETYVYCDRAHSKMAEVIEEISKLDTDKNSPIWQLHDHIQKGFSIGREDAIIDTLKWAALFLDKNHNNLSPKKFEQIRSDLNVVMNAVANDQLIVDVEALANDESFRANTLKILRPATFYKNAKFKDKADFKHFVDFHGNGHFHKDLTVDGTLTAGSEFVDCDLTVGCDIHINDSTSLFVGNVIKNNFSFIHNYPGISSDNTFVGIDAGNFAMTGGDNSGFGAFALYENTEGTDNTGLGFAALEFNTTGYQNTAAGSYTLGSNTTGYNNTAAGYTALYTNTTGYENTAVGALALYYNTTGNDNTAVGAYALEYNTTGYENTAVGSYALGSNDVGYDNTATGYSALYYNEDGYYNAAFGVEALYYNTDGYQNTALGTYALYDNTTGNNNTAVGYEALVYSEDGDSNTAVGSEAAYSNGSGDNNTALGAYTLYDNDGGDNNTAVGTSALTNLDGGDNNIALGYNAGTAFTSTESDNIDIGNTGVFGESGIIRIGTYLTHTAAFMQGIYTTALIGVPVEVNLSGQLGVAPSSAQYKKNIRSMGVNSEDIYKLRPVTFEYKNDADNNTQYGLIAEDVANVFPELVVYDKDNNPYTVRYQVLPVLLLNEVQKQQASIKALNDRVARLEENAPAA